MFIIFGTSTKRQNTDTGDVIVNGCPNCSSDLTPKEYAKFFTLFFIPLFKINSVGLVLTCERCDKDYDTAYTNYFYNRGLIAGLSEEKLQLFQAEFTMAIIAAILTADGRPQEAKERILLQFAASQPDMKEGLEVYYHEIKDMPYMELNNSQVQHYYNICKDNFQQGFQARILWRALQFIKTSEITLSEAGANAKAGIMRGWGYNAENEILMIE